MRQVWHFLLALYVSFSWTCMYQPVVIKFYHIYVLLFQWMSSILFALIGLDVRIIILDTEWTHCVFNNTGKNRWSTDTEIFGLPYPQRKRSGLYLHIVEKTFHELRCYAVTKVVTTFYVSKLLYQMSVYFMYLLFWKKARLKQICSHSLDLVHNKWIEKFSYLCMWEEQTEDCRLESECSTKGWHYLRGLCSESQNVDERTIIRPKRTSN